MLLDGLRTVVQVGDSEVRRENRHGIAENQVPTSIEDSLLSFWEMIQTEETRLAVFIVQGRTRRTTFESFAIMLDADQEIPA
jgi:hypothetical protein